VRYSLYFYPKGFLHREVAASLKLVKTPFSTARVCPYCLQCATLFGRSKFLLRSK